MSTSATNIQGQTSMSLSSGSRRPDSAIWQTTESKALELLALERITPPSGHVERNTMGANN